MHSSSVDVNCVNMAPYFPLACQCGAGPLAAADRLARIACVSMTVGSIFASLAALMFNCVDKDAIGNDYYSSYGDDSEWRSDCCSIRHQLIELISEFKLLPINQRIGY